jgi:hypothetical protein
VVAVGETDVLPFTEKLPESPLMLTLVALVVLQLSVLLWPGLTDTGLARRLMVGAGGTGGGVLTPPPPPPPHDKNGMTKAKRKARITRIGQLAGRISASWKRNSEE